ncbi:AraC family transcriptional regulator [Streptomyces sp. NPDC048297]|uniref:AraC family transcriptional regulator n=1 Tax=Streptomyces sp. NPDC048297 TaxID=3365531 RepID=UPI0037146966
MLLLDLDTVAREERVDAFQAAMDTFVPNDVTHEDPAAEVRARFEMWRVGGLHLFRSSSTGFSVRRTEKHLRQMRERPVVAVGLQTRSVGRLELAGRQGFVGPDDICVMHQASARTFGWSGMGGMQLVTMDADRLGLPVDVVAGVCFRLQSSPLYGTVLTHLRGLWTDPARLEVDPGGPALANATTELIRALLLSASCDVSEPQVAAAMEETLVARVLAYLRRHLGEADLTPERVAQAHAISQRQLYVVLSRAGIGLEQWLIEQRLEAARTLLASPKHQGLTIAAVAAQCGFSSSSHFTRRFQTAYGIKPSEWRRHARIDAVARTILGEGTPN